MFKFNQNTLNLFGRGMLEVLKTVTVDVFVSSTQSENGVRILKTPGQFPIVTKVQTGYVIDADEYHIPRKPAKTTKKLATTTTPRKSRKKS